MNSSSCDVSGKTLSSSSEDISTTRALSEGPPCSNIGEQWRREETSDGDPGGGGNPEGAGNGVETLLDNGLPSIEGERGRPFIEGECGRLVPLLSSIVLKQRKRKVKP
jgi:hypothetical protein